MLTQGGYAVLEAASGVQALKIARQSHGKINLLLTDVVMPHLSGPQLADELAPLLPEMKVLYMSGYTQFAMRHQEVSNQHRALLRKPFTRQDLASKVRDVLGE